MYKPVHWLAKSMDCFQHWQQWVKFAGGNGQNCPFQRSKIKTGCFLKKELMYGVAIMYKPVHWLAKSIDCFQHWQYSVKFATGNSENCPFQRSKIKTGCFQKKQLMYGVFYISRKPFLHRFQKHILEDLKLHPSK